MTYQDHRTIPLEVLRDFARSQSERTSIRQASMEAGIGKSTFHKFILKRSTPQPRVRRLLGLWYLAEQAAAPDMDTVRPYATALSILLSDVPAVDQEPARALLVEAVQVVYGGAAPLPRWVHLLVDPSPAHSFTMSAPARSSGAAASPG